MDLPHATEDIKWGNDLCFCLAKKMFCVGSLASPLQIAMKVEDDEFNDLSISAGIKPAPYSARYKWVLVTDIERFNKKQWIYYIKKSYGLIKGKLPKSTLKKLEAGGDDLN